MLRVSRFPGICRLFLPGALFLLDKGSREEVVLTFDDGPHPDSTPVILQILDEHDVKAVFFCNGEACEKYPSLLSHIKCRGHQTGNHGYHHIKGPSVSTAEYLENARRASTLIDSRFFRPPYGLMTCRQFRRLKDCYSVVMWDLMTYDYDARLSPAAVLKNTLQKSRAGYVIALHDKPGSHSLSILGNLISGLKQSGFGFTLLPEVNLRKKR
jgi:peptidoglycan/xylan/chitin deacetylase (PgdA/CDA1 family)